MAVVGFVKRKVYIERQKYIQSGSSARSTLIPNISGPISGVESPGTELCNIHR